MTGKQIRKRDAKLYHEARKEVLVDNNPEIWIVRNGLEMSLGMAMDDIYNYIYACYWMDDNPLRHLRRYFPDFTWSLHEDVSPDKLESVLGVADYIWVAGLEIGDGFITATQIGRTKPRVLCFLSKTGGHSGWNTMIRKCLDLWVTGVRFVDGDGDDARTTII